MKSVSFGSGLAVPAFTVLTTDPNYWTLRADYEYVVTMKALYDAPIEITRPEVSDMSTWVTDLQDGIDDYIERYEELLQTGTSEVIANLPDVLTIMTTVISGGADAVLAALMQGVLDVASRHVDTRATVHEGGGDPADLIEKLEEIREQIEVTLNEFTINLLSQGDMQTWSVGPVPEPE